MNKNKKHKMLSIVRVQKIILQSIALNNHQYFLFLMIWHVLCDLDPIMEEDKVTWI